MTHPLDGWDIGRGVDAEWLDWGDRGDARAKFVATGDGYVVAFVEAQAGYVGGAHEHTNTEFLYVLDGRVRSQGQVLNRGDSYVAAAGSHHTDFEAETPSTYLIIFKL